MNKNKGTFNSHDYWQDRLQSFSQLQGTGYSKFTSSFNDWFYKIQLLRFNRRLTHFVTNPSDRQILDIGSGFGVWVKNWKDIGVAKIVASDFSEYALENLRFLFPKIECIQFDITGAIPEVLVDRRFDIISVMAVMFHVLNDDEYINAIKGFNKLLTHNGLLILSERLPKHRTVAAEHFISRSENDVRQILDKSGFEILDISPLVVFFPPFNNKLITKCINFLFFPARKNEFFGNIIGAAMFYVEFVMSFLFKNGWCSNLLICKKKLNGDEREIP